LTFEHHPLSTSKSTFMTNCDYTFDTLKETYNPESLEVRAVVNNPTVGAPDVLVDGCLQSGYGDNRYSETGEDVWLHEVQIAQA
jgi:hypothetical protein